MPDFKDVQPPKLIKTTGAHHPINHMKDSIMNLLISIGFEVKDGPEIETESFPPSRDVSEHGRQV